LYFVDFRGSSPAGPAQLVSREANDRSQSLDLKIGQSLFMRSLSTLREGLEHLSPCEKQGQCRGVLRPSESRGREDVQMIGVDFGQRLLVDKARRSFGRSFLLPCRLLSKIHQLLRPGRGFP
jgi:hypothetical protein